MRRMGLNELRPRGPRCQTSLCDTDVFPLRTMFMRSSEDHNALEKVISAQEVKAMIGADAA